MEKLDILRKKSNNIPALNSGGCGLSALAMYRWLKGNSPEVKKAGLVFFYSDAYEDDEIETLPAPSHCYLALDNEDGTYRLVDSTEQEFEWDGHEEIDWLLSLPYSVWVTEEEMVKCLNNETWNDFFNREKGMKKLQKIYKVDLSDIEVN
jgi:hypothetical protein